MSQQFTTSAAGPEPSDSWKPTASLEVLRARARLLRRIREFFDNRGFCEVQTPVLGNDTVVDRHLDPIQVSRSSILAPSDESGSSDLLYLQTSPEFGMKRLLAAGLPAIYQIGPAFRAAERGPYHNPEFTMLEWYRAGDDLQQGTHLLAELVQAVVGWQAPDRVTYAQAFENVIGHNPHSASVADLAICGASALPVERDWSQDKDDWLNLIFAELIQPQLGSERPVILTNYPASQSALARLTRDSPPTAERFELFLHGVELANGYHELTDATELEVRNQTVNQQRLTDGRQPLPVDSKLLVAMRAGLPPSAGCALGLDRFVMVHLGLKTIDQVLPFPIDRS